MNEDQFQSAKKIICDLIDSHKSLRIFARLIEEDSSDCFRWKKGASKIRPHAVIKICKMFGIKPQELRPDIFSDDVILTFKRDKQCTKI